MSEKELKEKESSKETVELDAKEATKEQPVNEKAADKAQEASAQEEKKEVKIDLQALKKAELEAQNDPSKVSKEPFKVRIIVVTSGKGGVGKTTS